MGNIGGPQAPMRLAGAAERGSVESLNTLLNAGNQGERWEVKQYKIQQDTHKLLADGIKIKIPDDAALAIVEDLA
jgi:hypothetical protein